MTDGELPVTFYNSFYDGSQKRCGASLWQCPHLLGQWSLKLTGRSIFLVI